MRGPVSGVPGVLPLCLTLLLAPAVHASPGADWDAVLGLKPGTEVTVRATDGSVLWGRLARVGPIEIVVLNLDGLGLSDRDEAYLVRKVAQREIPTLVHAGGRLDLAPHVHSLPQSAVARVAVPGKASASAGGVLLGGLAGLVAGAYAGAAVERIGGPGSTEYPGLAGALVGAPIGLIAGAVGGHKLATRDLGVIYEREAADPGVASAPHSAAGYGGPLDSRFAIP